MAVQHDIITSMRIQNWHRWMSGLLAAGLTGCAAIPATHHADSHKSHPLPPELANYYHYDPLPLQAHVESTDQKSGYQLHHLSLSPANPSGFRAIRIDWYQPNRSGRLPLILMSPILAGNDLYVREFAHFFAARGMHAVIIYRQKEIFSADRELKEIESHFRESVIQLRQALDWLEIQPTVDPNQIGTFAISLGAILTTPLAAVDHRIHCSVFGLPAGHIPEIIMTSKDKAIRKRRRAYLERHGWNQTRGLEELRKVIISEPMRFAPAVESNRSLVIVGLFDRVLGLGRSLEFWHAMGRPDLIVLPTGHYTAYFATPYLKIATYSFLRRHIGLKREN